MKNKISIIFFLLSTLLSIKAFAQFNSDPDVLMYLNGKTFTNQSVGVSLSFSEVGSQLSLNGNLKFYQPNIRVISRNKALVTYIGITDPSVKAGLIVDCSLNTVEDRSIGRVYSYNSSTGKNRKADNKVTNDVRVKAYSATQERDKLIAENTAKVKFAPSMSNNLNNLSNGAYNPNLTYGIVIDLGGKQYKTIKIGIQEWMADNLDVNTFQNGDLIPEAKTQAEWDAAASQGKPAWCYYNYDKLYQKRYGKLYNWFSVNDLRGLAPKGWHIPDKSEWEKLMNYLGGKDIAGHKMCSKTGWIEKNKLVSNESGFTALPGGYHLSVSKNPYNGGSGYSKLGEYGIWWSTSEDAEDTNSVSFFGIRNLRVESWNEQFGGYCAPKGFGLSVRCLKNQ